MREGISTGKERRALPLAFAMGGFLLLWVIWYPPSIAISDESAYLTQAQLYSAGILVGDASAQTTAMRETGRGWVSKYPPAQSLVLAPTQWFHWRTGFLVPLGLALLATVFCAATLERSGLPGAWSLLLLLHPAVVLYSRTLMSETLALLMVAVAFWASDPDRPRSAVAGVVLGIMPAVREALLPIAFVLGGLMALRRWRTGGVKAIAPLALGAGIPLVALATYNHIVFGDSMSLRVDWDLFTYWAGVLDRGSFYFLALNLLWPGMLVGICAAEYRRKLDVILMTAAGLVVYVAYSHVDRRYGMPADLVVGLRFFVPLLPVLVLGYVALLHRCWSRGLRSVRVQVFAALVLVAANAAVAATHQGFLGATARRRETAIESTREAGVVIAHRDAAELFNPAWGGRPVAVVRSVEELLQELAVLACTPGGTVGVAQGASAVALAAAPSAVTPTDGLAVIRSDPSTCPDTREEEGRTR